MKTPLENVFVGLGSNVGDRETNLAEARRRLGRLGFVIVDASGQYETEPVGYTNQSWFLNQVIRVRLPEDVTDLHSSADDLATAVLLSLHRVEAEMGRERLVPGGPRVIDLDLLLLGDLVAGHTGENDASSAVVPHPRMHERRFVLEPLCEIAPDVIHPVLRVSCSDLLARLRDDSEVRRSQT